MEKQSLQAFVNHWLVEVAFGAYGREDLPELSEKMLKELEGHLKKREDVLRSKHITDLAQAVGILQGLGHPNDLLERHYQEAVSRLRQKE